MTRAVAPPSPRPPPSRGGGEESAFFSPSPGGRGPGGGGGRTALVEALAWSLWATLLIATSVLAVRHPAGSIFDAYRDGVHHWWAGEPLYSHDARSFVYLTSSPLIFTPFTLLGPPLDDLVWRIFSVALFLYALWRLVALTLPTHARLAMAIIL